MKKRIIYATIAVAVFFAALWGWLNWDIAFSEVQHWYYTLEYASSPSTSGSAIEEGALSSSYLNGTVKKYQVYLPPAYFRNTLERFPVVYLLHGYPGTDRDWLTNTNLQKRLDEKIRQKTIPPVIVVFPDMNGPSVRDSQYIDATRINQDMESYFIRELVPHIDSRYRTLPVRDKRAIGGLSSGGWGALYLGIKYSGLFSYVFSHSGYMINREAAMDILVGKKAEEKQQFNILTMVQKYKPALPYFLYADIGRNDDRNFLADNEKFDALLSRLHIPHVFRITPGGHGWGVWSKNIDNSLSFLPAVFSPPVR